MSIQSWCYATHLRLCLAGRTLPWTSQVSFLVLMVSCLMLTDALGQVPNFRIQEIPLSVNTGVSDSTGANEMNNLGMVVGYHTPGGARTGYVYDHYGLIGPAATVHSLSEWIPALPSGWTTASCVGINDLGQVVGYFSNAQSQRIGYCLDLDLLGGGAAPSWVYLPAPSSSSYGKLINDNQDVLLYSRDTYQGHLYNLATGDLRTLEDPVSGVPLAINSGVRMDLNNWGQVVGWTLEAGFRLTPGILLEYLPVDGPYSINNAGLMAATLPPTGSGKRATPRRACRYGSQIEVLSSIASSTVDINNEGDVVGQLDREHAVYHDGLGRWVKLDGLLVGSAADLAIWNENPLRRGIMRLSDREATGFGQMLASVVTYITTGNGKNQVTTTITRFFVLTPELPNQP